MRTCAFVFFFVVSGCGGPDDTDRFSALEARIEQLEAMKEKTDTPRGVSTAEIRCGRLVVGDGPHEVIITADGFSSSVRLIRNGQPALVVGVKDFAESLTMRANDQTRRVVIGHTSELGADEPDTSLIQLETENAMPRMRLGAVPAGGLITLPTEFAKPVVVGSTIDGI